MNRRVAKEEDVKQVLDGLRRIVRGLRLSARGAERTAGISGAQLFVLQSLSEEPASSLNELADRTFTDQSSVSVVVRRLVEQELVERRPSKEDARRIELRLTPAGRRLLKRCPEPTQVKLVAALRRLAPADLVGLRVGLVALVRSLGMDDQAAQMFEFSVGLRPPSSRSRSSRGRELPRWHASFFDEET